jgi:hypothetical protein
MEENILVWVKDTPSVLRSRYEFRRQESGIPAVSRYACIASKRICTETMQI